jgi:hypothetical protein
VKVVLKALTMPVAPTVRASVPGAGGTRTLAPMIVRVAFHIDSEVFRSHV